LTDGGDDTNFKEAIAYAIKHNLQIFIFDIASKSGGSMRTKNGLLKDQDNF
jgi:Ca-activated chloride channel family protein